MKNLKKLTAYGAVVAFAAVGSLAFAQDDLDDLLKDLEGDTTAEETKAGAKEAAEEAVAEVKAEVKEAVEEAKEEVKEAVAEAKEEVAEAVAPAEEAKAEEAAPAEEEKAEEAAPAEEGKAEETAPAEEEKAGEAAPAEAAASPDAELLSNIRATEELRRKAYDEQAKREIIEARAAMEEMEYSEAAKHYHIALKLLNDSQNSKKYRRECEQGVAEGLYRAALQEDRTGRRDRAIKYIEKAIDMRHPKARKQLEVWLLEKNAADKDKRDVSAISHRRNDEDFKLQRKADMKLLKRSRQLLAVRDLDGAREQCEIVLKAEPYNEEALRLREQIIKKQEYIVEHEKEVARDGWIAEVAEKWRPVYAPNAKKLGEVVTETYKKPLGEDPERSAEQKIIERMKGMRLPTISFKPPATIIDAVEFFRGASKDYDDPKIPLEQRGFNFVLKTPEALTSNAGAAADDGDDSFSATAEDEAASAGQAGVPVIPMITASDVSFYEALKLVCDSVGYKFKVQGKIVMVMQKDMTTDEMVTRSYPVLGSFIERMGSASSDMKEMRSAGFGGGAQKEESGEENQEKDWKSFFEMMGVQWPEGSTIMYIKTIGKLRVKNTYENLAELEKALTELNVDQKLVEIEARFVEVCQEDLNSLGFEWILNSDYAIPINGAVGRLFGLKEGTWGSETGSRGFSTTHSGSGLDTYDSLSKNGGKASVLTSSSVLENNGYDFNSDYSYSTAINSQGSRWVKSYGNRHNLGVNAMGGDAEYGNTSRFLSTVGNHISGENKSSNDQFMRVNAFLGSADLSMILHMLSQRSDTDLLSAPKVLTKPGEEAVIKVVTEYIYPTDYDVQLQSSGGSGGGGYSSGGGSSMILAVVEPQSFTMREVGVILDVTPTLTDDGNLIDLKLNTQVVDEPTWKNYGMKIPFSGNTSSGNVLDLGGIFTGAADALVAIGASLSEADRADMSKAIVGSAMSAADNLSSSANKNIEYYDAPMQQPFFHVRSIDSSVSINPGSTIVMGGLITEERKAMDDKIPFLGDIPFIGRLFRSHSEWTNKRNLLIFVTTRLVDVRGREVTLGSRDELKAPDVKAAPKADGE